MWALVRESFDRVEAKLFLTRELKSSKGTRAQNTDVESEPMLISAQNRTEQNTISASN